MSKDSKQTGAVTVDGIEYSWEFRHASRFDSSVGLCGPSVVVCLRPTHTRDLIIDFPISTFDPKGKPRKAILVHHVTSVIRSALASGWEPESRGKPFRFNVKDTDYISAA
jgi:hypothetical protein